MISKKGKRKLEFQGNTYYWHIKEDRDKNLRIHISSEDKSFYLTCGFDREIGVGTRHIKAFYPDFLQIRAKGLLHVHDVRGLDHVYVGGIDGCDDLNQTAQASIKAYYERQGLLYDIHRELKGR